MNSLVNSTPSRIVTTVPPKPPSIAVSARLLAPATSTHITIPSTNISPIAVTTGGKPFSIRGIYTFHITIAVNASDIEAPSPDVPPNMVSITKSSNTSNIITARLSWSTRVPLIPDSLSCIMHIALSPGLNSLSLSSAAFI